MLEEEIELSDPQYDFLTSKKKHSGFVAGFGSGKSYIGTLKSQLKIINDHIPKTAYYLPTYGDIRDIAFDTVPTVAEQLGYKYKLNKTDKEFILYDRGVTLGKTLFRNMSEPESIVGYQTGYALIDETDILPMEKMDKAFKKILGRNRLIMPVKDEITLKVYNDTKVTPQGTYFHKKAKCLCWVNNIDVAGTPEGYKWFYNRFVTRFKESSDVLIRASTYSNLENLSEDFIETLRAEYTPELFEAYVNGYFVNLTSGTVYSYFDRKKHHIGTDAEANETIHAGQDFNVNGCITTIHVIRQIEGKETAIRVREIETAKSFDIVDNIKSFYPKNKLIMYPDSSGNNDSSNATKTDIQLLRDKGAEINAPKANGRIMDRVNSFNSLFYQGRYLINTNQCEKGTNSLEQQAYDKLGKPEKFAGAGTIDDYNDSSGYFVVRMFPMVKNTITVKTHKFT